MFHLYKNNKILRNSEDFVTSLGSNQGLADYESATLTN